MISGGAGAWRSWGSWEAIPKPMSQTLPASLTSTFAGLTSLCMRPCRWTWPSADAKPIAMFKTRVRSSGRPRSRSRSRSRGSPPGSLSTRIVRPW